MILYPAIDIKNGQCVRLVQGDFQQKKIYGENPVEIAKQWKKAGSNVLHVVDLDGARDGKSSNGAVIAKIVAETGLQVQIGGGIRSLETIQYWLDLGVHRVILGTAAVENPSLVEEAVQLAGNRIVVSVDVKNQKVATNGWEKTSEVDANQFCQRLEAIGVETIVYTDITKDGMLTGPNLEAYQILKEKTSLQVIASGGISSLEDLQALKKLKLYGAITGKALYEGKFRLEEALQCLQEESSRA